MDMPPTAPSTPDQFLNDGDTYTLGQETFQIWHLPGHEPSHIILYHPEQGVILGGDVLFPNGHGRVDIPGADAQVMQQSLARLSTLPDNVTVYPGHGDPRFSTRPHLHLSWNRGPAQPFTRAPWVQTLIPSQGSKR